MNVNVARRTKGTMAWCKCCGLLCVVGEVVCGLGELVVERGVQGGNVHVAVQSRVSTSRASRVASMVVFRWSVLGRLRVVLDRRRGVGSSGRDCGCEDCWLSKTAAGRRADRGGGPGAGLTVHGGFFTAACKQVWISVWHVCVEWYAFFRWCCRS